MKTMYQVGGLSFKFKGGRGINKNFIKILNNIYALLILFFIFVIFPKLFLNFDSYNKLKFNNLTSITQDVFLTSG